jgi:hypothetical protein
VSAITDFLFACLVRVAKWRGDEWPEVAALSRLRESAARQGKRDLVVALDEEIRKALAVRRGEA